MMNRIECLRREGGNRMTIAKLALAALVVFVGVRPAHAQKVEAEALFREGKELLKQGKVAEACVKFDASDRLDPSVGSELNAADCHEKNNELATAWAGFLQAAGNAAKSTNDKARETEARRRAALLEPKLSYLTLTVPESSRLSGLTIKRNGTNVDAALWNTPVPVDAGDYEIAGQAPDHAPWSTKVTIATSERKSVEVPRFKEVAPGQTPETPRAPVDTNAQPPVEHPHETPAMRKAAIAVGVGSVVLLGAGLTFELLGRSSYSDAKAETMDQARRNSLESSANTKHHVAQGLAIGGVAAAGAAVFMYLSSRHQDEPETTAARVVVSPSGIALVGQF